MNPILADPPESVSPGFQIAAAWALRFIIVVAALWVLLVLL
ncbi:MAG: hypothetical protein QOE58_1286, partial [Actinomycetota bacterium]|nr:hypothetical protein [Actinomycetota bacterium]